MKKLSIIMMIFSFFSLQQAYAQMSKAEAKEWKKKGKSLGPQGLKDLVDENETNKVKVTNFEARVTNLEQEKGDLEQEIKDLKDALARKEAEAKALAESAKAAVDTTASDEMAVVDNGSAPSDGGTKKSRIQKGVVFKVQIGAFRNKDLTKYLNRHKNFSGEVDADGTMKYTLGVFSDYWEADTFKKYLREMGVKDAWVVAYRNGQRANIKDVLEGY